MSTELILTPTMHPSVYNHDRYEKVSPRYTVVETDTIKSALADDGWEVTSAQFVRSRLRPQFGKHLLRFHNDRFPRDIDGDLPELVLGNAHDLSGALLVAIGLNVFICTNGLISAKEGDFFKLRHIGLTMEKILETIITLSRQIPALLERKGFLKGIEVNDVQQTELANRVLDLRFDGKTHKVNPADLVSNPLRGQEQPNLWNTYQTIQRKMINGDGLRAQREGRKPRLVRGIKRVTENIRINMALDNAINEFAAELGYTF